MNGHTNTISIILATIYFVAILVIVAWYISYRNYLRKHKKELTEAFSEKSQNAVKECEKLQENKELYERYYTVLGLNTAISCGSSVVSGASQNPLKYIMKYSNIDNSSDDIERLEFMHRYMTRYDKFLSEMALLSAVMQARFPLMFRIISSKKKISWRVLGLNYGLSKYNMPTLSFHYSSPTGKSQRSCSVKIDATVMELIIAEVQEKVSKKGHSRAQRAAMSNDLREAIKRRDNYTRCKCGNSVYKEPNLLLEVDYIVPISKGGKTEADSLQTLCWRCNRAKSDRL